MCVSFSISEGRQNVNNQIFGDAKLIDLPITCYLVPCILLYLPEKAWLLTMVTVHLTIWLSQSCSGSLVSHLPLELSSTAYCTYL
jgi:hypothetical protein